MFTVSIAIDADSADAAAEVVKDWQLTPGAVVQSIVGRPDVYSPGLPATVPDDGDLGSVVEENRRQAQR